MLSDEGPFALPSPRPITALPSASGYGAAKASPSGPIPVTPQPTMPGIRPGAAVAYADVYPGTGGMQVQTIAALQAALPPEVAAIIADWPERPRTLAQDLFEKYGPPQDACKTRLVWTNNGPWRSTVLYRDGVPHYWPRPHEDFLEQTIEFKIDPRLYGDLAEFDGSVSAERTSGRLIARCDNEAMNFVAVNLARDIAVGEIGVSEARDVYVEAARMYLDGEYHPLAEDLVFEMPEGYQGDPDEPAF